MFFFLMIRRPTRSTRTATLLPYTTLFRSIPAPAPDPRMTDKPFAPACERNREPILAVLRERFAGSRHALEVGSGTGQHAVHFAAAMPWLQWQCSDRAEYLPGIRGWLDEIGRASCGERECQYV